AEAGCVVVLWSPSAIGSPWVRHEASQAMARGVYAPCRIAMVPIDVPFNQVQATDLLDWRGEENHPGIQRLMRRVDELLPPRKSLARRAAIWGWDHALTIGAVAFAFCSLGVLAWQTRNSREQLGQLSQLIGQQQEA